MTARFAIETASAPGAVGVIRVWSDGAGSIFDAVPCRPVGVGAARVRRLFDLDDALVARPEERTVLLMPHGGSAVMRAIAEALADRGVIGEPGPRGVDGEHAVESRMPAALATAASPLAVDLLLDQPRRWRELGEAGGLADGAVLGRLLAPATVVAVGAPNIGKSSLLNALAGREAALAFDAAGTTRDAVGVMLDCAGVVVRWIDTPGLDGGASEAIAWSAAERADLVLRCRDAGGDAPPLVPGGVPEIVVVTRADRSPHTGEGIRTSAADRQGLEELVLAIREALVPAAALRDRRPWRFWA